MRCAEPEVAEPAPSESVNPSVVVKATRVPRRGARRPWSRRRPRRGVDVSAARPAVTPVSFEWSQPGSNRRPLACHASALPAELWPHERPQSSLEIEVLCPVDHTTAVSAMAPFWSVVTISTLLGGSFRFGQQLRRVTLGASRADRRDGDSLHAPSTAYARCSRAFRGGRVAMSTTTSTAGSASASRDGRFARPSAAPSRSKRRRRRLAMSG
jgi:hypothetical protein